MKPKYTERIRQAAAFSLATLALNCTDPLGTAKGVVDDTRWKVEELSSAVDARWELKQCLQQAHPEKWSDTELMDRRVIDFRYTVGLDMISIDCGEQNIQLDIGKPRDKAKGKCSINVREREENIHCGDSDGDSTWDYVNGHGENSFITHYKTSKPERWKKWQKECNGFYNRCFDQEEK